MSVIGKTVVGTGEIRAMGDVTIEGRVNGPVLCEDFRIVVTASAAVAGDLIARDITVLGRCTGKLIATEVVQIAAGADVNGQVHAPRFVLDDGAVFNGRVQPGQLETALRVAR